MECNVAICGSLAAADASYDADWYRVELDVQASCLFTFTVASDLSTVVGLINIEPRGSGDCSGISQQAPLHGDITPGNCQVGQISGAISGVGTCYFYVAPKAATVSRRG